MIEVRCVSQSCRASVKVLAWTLTAPHVAVMLRRSGWTRTIDDGRDGWWCPRCSA